MNRILSWFYGIIAFILFSIAIATCIIVKRENKIFHGLCHDDIGDGRKEYIVSVTDYLEVQEKKAHMPFFQDFLGTDVKILSIPIEGNLIDETFDGYFYYNGVRYNMIANKSCVQIIGDKKNFYFFKETK